MKGGVLMEDEKKDTTEEQHEEVIEEISEDKTEDLNAKIEELEKTILVKLNEIEEKIISLITSDEEVEQVEEDEDLFDY